MSVRTASMRWALFWVVVAAVAWRGWALFSFMTDDAFIAFRYVSNSMAGWGFVWNPPPFHPVEGYTSFLWVLLLKTIWTVVGIEPPAAANVLTFISSLGTLFLGYRFVRRMVLPESLEPWRWPLLALVLLATLTNRTFLAWMSSGLETALFNLLFTWWLYEATAREGRASANWVLRLSLSAALTALCRPDGLLPVVATPAILTADQLWGTHRSRGAIARAWPLLLVPAHFLWRHSFYGEWLPNTYYAKYDGWWPESGARYLGSFVLEYGVWVWILLLVIRMVQEARRAALESVPRVIPFAVVAAHVIYYTFVIGGDHFEFRVYSVWVLPLYVSTLELTVPWASWRRWLAPLALGVFILAGWPIPWVHWWKTQSLTMREQTHEMTVPVAQDFPAVLRPVVSLWDDWQKWLIHHFVCMRHQEHKVFEEQLAQSLPSRERGGHISWEARAVAAGESVGLEGWVLPNVAIIDEMGLNDRVIARSTIQPTWPLGRLMAHYRQAPPGYIECFQANVILSGRARNIVTGTKAADESEPLTVVKRSTPLTDDMIVACERLH